MKKISTAMAASNKNFSQKLTIGLDLGNRSSWYCVLDEAGEVVGEQKLGTTPKAMREVFAAMPRSRVARSTWLQERHVRIQHPKLLFRNRTSELLGLLLDDAACEKCGIRRVPGE
jgi:transposase